MNVPEAREKVLARATELVEAMAAAHMVCDRTTAIAMVLLGIRTLYMGGLDEHQLGMAYGALMRIALSGVPKTSGPDGTIPPGA